MVAQGITSDYPDSLKISFGPGKKLSCLEIQANTQKEVNRLWQYEEIEFIDTYKRLDNRTIGGYQWINLEIRNNYENHGESGIFVLKKNQNYYSIRTTTDCDQKLIDDILGTLQID